MSEKKVFVTVGTTSFDDLISTILNHEVLEVYSQNSLYYYRKLYLNEMLKY